MYEILSKLSNFLSSPFLVLLNDTNKFPIFAAFLLGLVGALAPCQLTGNISAITYYGNKSLHTKEQWHETSFFVLGKIVVYSGLGLTVWLVGHPFQTNLTHFFAAFRKLMGPFIMFIGLFLIGFLKLKWINLLTSFIPQNKGGGLWGSFLMGVSFSIAFCPTMFVLFFFTLMPIILHSSYGAILPTIFAIGTSLPLVIFMFIIWFIGLDGLLMKKGRRFGAFVQKGAGIFLIIIGILDTITYWGI